MAAASESETCFECGGEFTDDRYQNCGGCLCKFHMECLRIYEKDNAVVCTQCFELMSKEEHTSNAEQFATPKNRDIPIDQNKLLRAPKVHLIDSEATSSFSSELVLFKLHLLEEEQKLAEKRQREKEQRCREINEHKDKQMRRLQAMRDAEILRKEREEAECIARMERMELEFQQQQQDQDAEFIRKKTFVITNPTADVQSEAVKEPSNSGQIVVEVNPCSKKLTSNVVDQNHQELLCQQDHMSKKQSTLLELNLVPKESNVPEIGVTKQHVLSSINLASRKGLNNALPKFAGNPREWPYFLKRFESTTNSCNFDDVENLSRLNDALQGSARESVSGLLLHEHNVPTIMQRLQTFFGQPKYIITEMVSELRNEKQLRLDNLRSILQFSNKVSNLVATLQTAEASNHLWSPYLINDVVGKLPLPLQREWARYKKSYKEVNLEIFSMWFCNEAEMLTDITSKSLLYDDRENRNTKAYVNLHEDQKSYSKTCFMCSGKCESLSTCPEFKSLGYGKRMEFVSKKFLCRSCLSRCKKKCNKTACGIDGCAFYHHELLHKNDKKAELSNESIASINAHISNRVKRTWFKVLPVILRRGERSIRTLALLDGAASLSLLEDSLANFLNLEGTPQELCMKWTNGTHQSINDSRRVFLTISSVDNLSKSIRLNDVRTVKTLDLPCQSMDKEAVEEYKHLKDIPFASYKEGKPQILIGLDNARLISVMRRRVGGSEDPIAEKTELGWVISGGASFDHSVCHVSKCTEEDHNLEKTLKQFIVIDTLGTTSLTKPLLSKDDERAISLMERHCRRVGDKYEAPLLWKFDVFNCPNNYDLALKRLICLEKKMEKDPALASAVNQMIRDYLLKGYVKKVCPTIDPTKEDGWFLPTFVVKNHNKPSKLRIVWDAAAKFRNIALNSLILKGPDLTANILSVLFRFQERRIAIAGDIKEMYHQVGVKESDRKYLRFLHRENSFEKPTIYEMQVMVFGAACSGFCAQYILNKNADRFQETFPEAVESIKSSHYVDDLLDSADSEELVLSLANRIRQIHAEGGFIIRNWLSNSSVVMKTLNGENSQSDKMISLLEEDREKVLGMWWRPTQDVFTFSLKYNKTEDAVMRGETIPTKRQMLKLIMSVFDPLGFLSHFLTLPKILMQDVWRSNINWDEAIKTEQFEQWSLWLRELPSIEKLSIPRAYFSSNVLEVEMHTFVDASEEAYAACVYFKAAINNTAECRLVTSKSRVAPIRSCSIPRLELQSAVLGSRLANRVMKDHRFNVIRKIFWSDSRTVLAWIRSDHRKYHQYVACRVGEIIELTDIRDWRWVPTNQNISDRATRKVVPEIASDDCWFKGPDFLYQCEDQWPVEKEINEKEVIEELRPRYAHAINFHHVKYEVDRFSNWSRLLRSQAFLLRFVFNIKAAVNKTDPKYGIFSREEYVKSERILIIQAQMEEYEDEYALLSKNKSVARSSCLNKYSPYIDNAGLIRCSSRLDVDSIPASFRAPIILPNYHRVTFLILGNYHKMYAHRNFETVVNEVNQRYVVPYLRKILKLVRKECQRCRVIDARAQTPRMSALPPERLSPFFSAFTFTGIDFFGPLMVVVGRHREKRWGVIMTCLNTRAIHIEVAFSLSTDSCILALKRFMAIRGVPQKFFSDNGTNFRGAARELREAIQNLDKVTLAENFISSVTEWSFIPPSAPHMGGAWERMVRSVKEAITYAYPRRVPSDELLLSMLSATANIINSRPLTFVPLDNESAEALTPNHFLIRSSNGIKSMVDINIDGEFLRKSWHRLEVFEHKCWKKWLKAYTPTLVRREKWNEDVPNLNVGDIVFIIDDNASKNEYKRGKIVETSASRDGRVRKATVQTAGKIYFRPACKLAKIDVATDDGTTLNVIPGGAVTESAI